MQGIYRLFPVSRIPYILGPMSTHRERARVVARLQIITAMVTFGTIGVFVRNIPLSSAEIAFWRGVIAFLVLSLFMLTHGKSGFVKA